MNKRRLSDAIYGLAIGDAFGVPYEFKERGLFDVKKEMIGYGSHNQRPGTWSDDTSMTIATLAAFDNGILNEYDVAHEFLEWRYKDKYTAYDEVFDIGLRTQIALSHYMKYHRFLLDDDIRSNGNGSLMRILPVAFANNYNNELVNKISSITHPHDISKSCCRIYCHIIHEMLLHPAMEKKDIKLVLAEKNREENNILNLLAVFGEDQKNIFSDGYVIHSLEAALWSFFNGKNFKDTIITAVSLGNDTDTIAAIAGGIAGLYYGKSHIPASWKNTLVNKQLIQTTIKNV